MRNLHHQQQQHRLLLSFASLKCFIFMLLNAHLAKAEGAPSCSADVASSPTCPILNNSTLFPFLTSRACGSASSFLFSGCDTASSMPTWPNFINATSTAGQYTLGPPFVIGFSNPFSPSLLHHLSSSHNSSISNHASISTTAVGAAHAGFGLINLTWANDTLIHQNTCQSLASLSQISHDLPQSIDLTSFAHSAFQFTLSNVILLFNCTSSSSGFNNLQKNSMACRSYAKECGLQKKESLSCYQYTPPESKKLTLLEVMKSLECENAMFFVVSNLSIPALLWSPRLIQLNWSTNSNSWVDSNYKLCELCLQSNGSCGYNDDDDFHCYCANHSDSDRICTPKTKSVGCSGFWCTTPGKFTIGVIAAGAVIAAVGAVIIGIVARNYHKKTRGFFTKIVPFRSAKTSARHCKLLCGSSSMIIRHLNDLDCLTERPIEYQYASMVLATQSFSNLLGEGGFGAVYKGILDDAKKDAHVQIAVKVLEVRSKHSKDQLFNEVVSIGRIHHVHVVRLLGFCLEENHEMLVYEYVINGSLDKWLFHCSDNHNRVLLWEQRYAIAIGMAKGLSYLHEECRHRIVHCDIKPQNILLDEHMRPKIADFGLARLMGREESRVLTLARGTPGYMGPEFWLGGESQLSTKFDVYSYGMVLLELISGQRNFGHGVYFPETAFEAAMGGNFESIMDVKLDISKASDGECINILDGMQRQQVQTALLVALWCIQDHPKNRPSMSEVVQYLEGTAAVNEQPPRPTIASQIISISAQAQHSYLSINDLHYDDDITPVSGGR